MPYRTRRRNFLIGATATGLAFWLQRFEAYAQGAPPPKRLLVIHHPVGTVKSNWTCQGTETDFTLSRILKPFEPIKSHMVVLDGMDIVATGVGGGHEQGTVVLVTGTRTKTLYPGNGGDDPKAEAMSVDQRLLKESTLLQGTPIESLQVSCDDRVDVAEVSTRRLSYSAPAAPMEPYLVPRQTYTRVFGSLMPGMMGSADTLAAARKLKKSVLDFGLRDLQKLRTLAPSAEWERLDAHADAIRALETELDATGMEMPTDCGLGDEPEEITPFTDSSANRIGNGSYSTTESRVRDDEIHAKIGKLHFAVIRAAFQCDLTRVVTFQWSPGTNHVSFQGQYPNQPSSIKMHHPLSHDTQDPNVPEFLTNVDTWYSSRTAELLQTLLDTKEGDGSSILDNTFIPYITEVARADHSWSDAPFLVFGGTGVGLVGNRKKKYSPRRPVNDLWLAAAKALGATNVTTLGDKDMYTGPLDILM